MQEHSRRPSPDGQFSYGSETITRAQLLRRLGAAGLAVPTLSTLLAACGSDDDKKASTSAGGGRADFAGETLTFLAAQPQAGAARLLKAEFERATGARVRYTVVPYDQIQAKATLDVQSGAAQFDVFQYWYTSVGALADQGVFEDITDWVESNGDIDAGDFIASIYDPYSLFDGKRYGLPFDGDYHILFYNTEIFEEARVEPPTTWEEYVDVAAEITAKLKRRGIYGAALLGRKTAFDIGSSFFNRLATSGGAAIVDGKPALGTPEALEAATTMQAVAPHALPTPLQTGFDTALPQWLAGRVGMMEFWTDLGAFSQDKSQSKVVDRWECLPLPVGRAGRKAAALNAGWAFAVSTAAKNRDLALAFIEFATSRQTNLRLATTTGSGIDPTRTSTLNAPQYKRFAPKVQEVAAQVAENAQPWPTVPQAPELIKILNDELALMLQGSKSPEVALEAIQSGWSDALQA